MTKKKPSLVLMIGFVAAFSAHADRIVEGDLILAGTSDGDAPAYDCSADTLPFIPGPVPTIGTVPAGDPILIPVPDFTNCTAIDDQLFCEFTCEPVGSSACIGLDCVDDEVFAGEDLKLKENNVRIRMVNKSLPDQFGNSWNIEANDSANGGNRYFDFQVRQDANELPFVLPQQEGLFPISLCTEIGEIFPGQDFDPLLQTFPALLTGGSIPVGGYTMVPVPILGYEFGTLNCPGNNCDAVCAEGKAPITEPALVRARQEGLILASQCSEVGQIFSNQAYDPNTRTFPDLLTGGSIPVGETLLVPEPSIIGFCPGNVCDAVCVQPDVAVVRSILNFGTADASEPIFGEGVAIGIESALENGTVSVGRTDLVRRLVNVAAGLGDTDVLTVASLDEINTQLDEIEEVIAAYENPVVLRCDTDLDGDIDRLDVRTILSARGQSASGPDDPMDADGDGVITRFDATRCARLMN